MLSLLSGSAASLATDALLTMTVPAGVSGFTLTTTVMVRTTAFAMAPRSHVRGCAGSPGTAVPPHDPMLGVALIRLTSIGRMSFTTTFGAVEGPLFLTVMV